MITLKNSETNKKVLKVFNKNLLIMLTEIFQNCFFFLFVIGSNFKKKMFLNLIYSNYNIKAINLFSKNVKSQYLCYRLYMVLPPKILICTHLR